MNECREKSGTVVEVTTSTAAGDLNVALSRCCSSLGNLDGNLGRIHPDVEFAMIESYKANEDTASILVPDKNASPYFCGRIRFNESGALVANEGFAAQGVELF